MIFAAEERKERRIDESAYSAADNGGRNCSGEGAVGWVVRAEMERNRKTGKETETTA